MVNQIVTVNVTQTVAPTPNKLQKTGAFLSQGGTNKTPGTSWLITQLADLVAIQKTPLAIASLAWLSNVVTATTSAPHGYSTGDHVKLTIAAALPVEYNGTYDCTISGASTFTYALTPNPGSETSPGTYVAASSAELLAMGTTFFAQGSSQSVYVLELGAGSPADGVVALDTFITNNPLTYYSYLVPRAWSDEATFLTFLADFESPTSKTYFFTTMTTDNYTDFTETMKCVVGFVEAPSVPATEFTLAWPFWVTLHYSPSSTNKVPPLAFAYGFGVTQYPTVGNAPLLAQLKAAGVNYAGVGSEGGISNVVLFWGTTMDVRPFNYWYSVDWVQINIDQNIANAVINGSNNSINPLYYNQTGIDRLQLVGAATLSSAITFGLALGTVVQTALDGPDFDEALNNGKFAGQSVINAVPFVPYSIENPGDYKIGNYAGFAVVYTPLRGFESITFNVNVTDFVAQ